MPDADARPDAWLDALRFENVCFDTMIIRHLVQAGGGDALSEAFAGRMYWPEAVQMELHLQSGRIPVLAAYLRLKPATVLELSEEEDEEAGDIRNDLFTRRTTKRDAFTNLGEAQCVVVCRRVDERYVFVCHDGRARDWARKHNLKPWTLIDVLYVFVRAGIKRPGQAWALYEKAVNDTAMFELAAFPLASGRTTFLAGEPGSIRSATSSGGMNSPARRSAIGETRDSLSGIPAPRTASRLIQSVRECCTWRGRNGSAGSQHATETNRSGHIRAERGQVRANLRVYESAHG